MTSRRISWLIMFASYISYSYIVTCIGPVLPALSKDLMLKPDFVGILASLSAIGAMLAVLGGWIADRYDKVMVTDFSILALIASCLLLWFASHPAIIGASFLIMGATSGFIEPAANAYISNLYPRKRGLSVILFHVGWNIGSTLGPLFSALTIAAIAGWREVYLFPLPALFLFFVLLSRLRKEQQGDQITQSHSSIALRSAISVLPVTLIMIFDMGLEMGINTWLAFILENQGSSVYEAGLTIGLFWGFMGIGRLILAPAVDKLGYSKTITVASGSALPCMIAAAVLSPLYMKMVLWMMSGLLLAPIFPALIAWGTSADPDSASTITGLMMTLGTLGQFFSIYLVGLVVAAFGVTEAQYVFVFFMAAVLTNAFLVRGHK